MKVYLLTYAAEDGNNSFVAGIFTSVQGAKDKAQTVYDMEDELGWFGPSDAVVDSSYDGCGVWEIVEYTLE